MPARLKMMVSLTDASWKPQQWLMNNLNRGTDVAVIRGTILSSIDILSKYHPSQGVRMHGYTLDQWESLWKQFKCLQVVEVVPKKT